MIVNGIDLDYRNNMERIPEDIRAKSDNDITWNDGNIFWKIDSLFTLFGNTLTLLAFHWSSLRV